MPVQGIDPTGLNHDISATLGGALVVEDTGVHTNPRAYELLNGFSSQVLTSPGPGIVALWTVTTTPVRTAGKITVVYWIAVYSINPARQRIQLRVGGIPFSVYIPIDSGEVEVLPLPTPIRVGDNDLDCWFTGANVVVQVGGIQEP